MIAVVFALLAARPVRALLSALLGALAVAAAVAAPVYLAAADQAVVAATVAGAPAGEAGISFFRPIAEGAERSTDLAEQRVPERLTAAGYTTVFQTSFDAAFTGLIYVRGASGVNAAVSRLTYRDGACAHLTMVSGRCPIGVAEIVVSERAAGLLGLTVGAVRDLVQIAYVVEDAAQTPKPVGAPVTVSIVGVYRPTDPKEAYWGPLPPVAGGQASFGRADPIFTTMPTVRLFDLAVSEYESIDLVPQPDAFTAARVDQLPADLDRLTRTGVDLGLQYTSDIPRFVDRLRVERAAVARLVPFAALPLVPLCWYVLFLAAGHAADERRAEFAVLAVRGLRRPQRWWLAAGEQVVPLLLGAPVGYLLGHLAVRVAARLGLGGGVAVPLTRAHLMPAGWALAGAMAAVLLAYRRELASRPLDLLRGVPPRSARSRSLAVEAAIVVVAGAAIIDARSPAAVPSASGLTLLAPALLVLAGALLAGRALPPVADRVARRALGRGRLDVALAAVELARRPPARRVLTLTVLAVGLLSFAVLARDVGTSARTTRSEIELGADRVLAVAPTPPAVLLDAVRRVDPAGRYAMAAVAVASDSGMPQTLMVDSPRLATVAAWPDVAGVPDARTAAARLHPPAGAPVPVDGGRVAVDATAPAGAAGLSLQVALTGSDGRALVVGLGPLRPGRHTYVGNIGGCAAGCRLAAVEFAGSTASGQTAEATVHELRQFGPDRSLLPGTRLAEWSMTGPSGRPPAQSSAASAGLRVAGLSGGERLLAPDVPVPMPVVGTPDLPSTLSINTPDGQTPAAHAGTVPVLPGAEATALIDLEYACRLVGMAAEPAGGQVWLGPHAPPDAADRLQAAGLVIVDDQRLADRLAALRGQGPALATAFQLVAAAFMVPLAMLGLALVVSADRRRRGADLRVLRMQGLRASVVGRAGLRGQLWLTGPALVAGPLLALAAWLAVGRVIPVFSDGPWPVPVPPVPRVGVIAVPWLVAGALLVAVALVAGRVLRRAAIADGGASVTGDSGR